MALLLAAACTTRLAVVFAAGVSAAQDAPPVAAPLTAAPAAPPLAAAPIMPPLAEAPLAPPLVLNGGFGEYRVGHFHAGVDLGTGERVGRLVHAPLSGWVERVRASGVGYGRSIYIRADDGRLLQLGHLDAFDEPLASYVAAVQESSGQYEQDLWPATARFRVRAGQRVAWSGESGAGGPHLHFEIRRGDMAYHPLRAGLAIADARAPELVSLTLEPLDRASTVERSAAPRTIRLRAAPDTVLAVGRLRAIVGAREGAWKGVDRMVPWSVAMEWDGRRIECRFDSVSWATDMPEGDYVYDAGRVIGERGLVLWAPPGVRPRVMLTDAPPTEEAGTILVRHGDAPKTVRLIARDLAGQEVVRAVVLQAGPGHPGVPLAGPTREPVDSLARALDQAGTARGLSAGVIGYASLPDSSVRILLPGARERDARYLRLGSATGTFESGAHEPAVIVRFDHLPQVARLLVAGGDPQHPWAAKGPELLVVSSMAGELRLEPLEGRLPEGAFFEPSVLLAERLELPPRGARGQIPVGPAVAIHPGSLPLRRAIQVRMLPPPGAPVHGVGLYRDSGDGWEYVGSARDSLSRRVGGDSRRLGTFALFADAADPRITPLPPPRRARRGPYSRWALEARVDEEGSGVEARASYVRIDGERRPAEWDAEERILRWRPLRPPARGPHNYEVVVADRAGNVARRIGAFVID